MTETKTREQTEAIAKQIEAQLDCLDSYCNGQCIVAAVEDDLPAGWVRVYDGTGEAWGDAEEILAALKAVEYDPDQVVRVEDDGIVCIDPNCPHWHGADPDATSEFAHAHSDPHEVTALEDGRGFELAWEALARFDTKPNSSRDWPAELIDFEQLEDGTVNDQPNCLITVQTNAGPRYAAGPHGVFSCALSDWMDHCGELAETREHAIRVGCE